MDVESQVGLGGTLRDIDLNLKSSHWFSDLSFSDVSQPYDTLHQIDDE